MEKQAPELQIPCLDTPWNGSSLPDISTTACMHWYTFHTNHFSSQIIKIPNLICTSHGKHSGIHICVLGDNVPEDIIKISEKILNDLSKNWVIFKHLDVKLDLCNCIPTPPLTLNFFSWLVGLREGYVGTQLLRYWHWSELCSYMTLHRWLDTFLDD